MDTVIDDLDAHARAWLERELPGRVVELRRDARWRPSWVADFAFDDGSRRELFVRAPRGSAWINPVTFRQELKIHRVLAREGIPVPNMYDTTDNWGLVMDRLYGKISVEENAQEPERGVIYAEYIDALARLHDIPVERFAEIDMYVPDDSAADIAMNHYDRCYAIYRDQMGDVRVPMMDFTYAWMKRNVPAHRTRKGGVTADSGQFLFRDGHLEALNDFEQFYIGDPAADFAGMRLRDIMEPLDIDRMVALYEARTGDVIDRYTVEYHSIGFNGVNGWLLWPTLRAIDAEQDYMVYISSAVSCSRWIVTSMALILGIDLPEIAPFAAPDPIAPPIPYAHLQQTVEKLSGEGRSGEYSKAKAAALALHLARWNDHGRAFVAEDLDAIAGLLGTRHATVRAAHAALSDFVLSAGPEHDRALVLYFHRWSQRYNQLFQGCGPLTATADMDLKVVDVPWPERAAR